MLTKLGFGGCRSSRMAGGDRQQVAGIGPILAGERHGTDEEHCKDAVGTWNAVGAWNRAEGQGGCGEGKERS